MLHELKEQFDRIIVFDTETTGIDCKNDEIIEVGILETSLKNGRPETVRSDDLLIRLSGGKKLPPFITELTGITEEMLMKDGISKEEAASKIASYLQGGRILLVAYNAQFDLCFLFYFLHSFGLAHLLRGIKMLDAMTVYKDRREYPHKLKNAIEAYGLSGENTHRAVDDAAATVELLWAMAEECDDLHRYINLFGYNPKYGVSGPKISSVTYVPQGYREVRKLYEKDAAGFCR